MRTVTRLMASTLITVLLSATLALAQGAQTGGITGVVLDSSGATVQNARVEIFNEATDTVVRTLNVGTDGNFTATLLPPGSYRVQVSAKGFKKYRALAVPVRINETTRHDVNLVVG